MPVLRRGARPAPRRRPAGLPPLRPPRARADPLRRLRLGLRRAPRHRRRAPRARARRRARPGRSSASTPASTRRRCSTPSAARRAACSSARRSSPRATTSPTSRSASSSTPTRPCASPTSAPRSARSRSSPSSPAGPAAGASGRVLVQTLDPTAPAIAHAARHDADGFLAGELARREALRYPPFASLIRIVCSAPDAAVALAAATALRARLDPPGAAVLGPAPLFRLRDKERVQLVVKATRPRAGDRRRARRRGGGRADPARAGPWRSRSTSIRSSERGSLGSRCPSTTKRSSRGEVARPSPSSPPEVRARREAALRHVRQWGDPVLKTQRAPGPELRRGAAHRGRRAWAS